MQTQTTPHPLPIDVDEHEAPLVHHVQKVGRLTSMSDVELSRFIADARALRASHSTRKSAARGNAISAESATSKRNGPAIDLSRFLGAPKGQSLLLSTPPREL